MSALDRVSRVLHTAACFRRIASAPRMRKAFRAVCVALVSVCTLPLAAETYSVVVVLSEAGFPTADSATPSPQHLASLLPGAHFASTEQLRPLLADHATRFLVLPYRSAFPQESWPDI